MTEEIVQLTAADFAEAMDVKHAAFRATDNAFADMLPLLYRPVNAGSEYAIRRDGRICALVGVFPMLWQVGDAQLNVAGIGGVSTLPDFRGQGLMSRLMHGAGAGCQRTNREADLDCQPLQAMRLLFGPLPPTAVTALTGANLLAAWCPLPLAWLRQDRV